MYCYKQLANTTHVQCNNVTEFAKSKIHGNIENECTNPRQVTAGNIVNKYGSQVHSAVNRAAYIGIVGAPGRWFSILNFEQLILHKVVKLFHSWMILKIEHIVNNEEKV